jgi:hypothetical protein
VETLMTPNYPSVEPPAQPTQPAADGRRPLRQSIVIDLLRLAAVVAVAACLFAFWVQPQIEQLQVDRQVQAMSFAKIADLLQTVDRHIEIRTPPNNDKMFQILSRGVTTGEDVIRTDTVSTTPEAAFATDLTTVQQTDAWTQEIVIQNTDTTTPADKLCFGMLPWATAGATCQLKCAASAFTCSGAATDGVNVSSTWQRRYDGTSCICVVGSAATVNYQTERVLR